MYLLETHPQAFLEGYFAILAHLGRARNPVKYPEMTYTINGRVVLTAFVKITSSDAISLLFNASRQLKLPTSINA